MDLVPLFQNFGYVLETRLQADRGFAFVKMDSHENAALGGVGGEVAHVASSLPLGSLLSNHIIALNAVGGEAPPRMTWSPSFRTSAMSLKLVSRPIVALHS
jgi:hypothetical protein